MLEGLPLTDMPAWLVAAPECLGELPLNDVLSNSVFYPACGVDGDPVKYLGGNFHSFVYADYGVGQAGLKIEANTFRGYCVLASRPVSERELTPNGWTPRLPSGYVSLNTPPPSVKMPFAEWIIYERQALFPATHGPERFSLLYIGGDGVATFQALYHSNNATPAVTAVIQPGAGWGGNWTNFDNRDEILAWSVLDAFPDCRPKWLLNGGYYEMKSRQQPCWPEYTKLVRVLRPGLRLWERPGAA